ncbi:uncharacterized protein LOC110422611 [Herrania umbratica]|uniref:Uncharacterized protein LOC110422611 n=1 Tax=Herrania umbratica TaxID=108875 RepID=A0A6J1AYN4_9ROSI|nr:uncharacterized protein LOC110422611 [Herrania umbratica]
MMCSETSPRLSFSRDLGQADDLPIELNESRRDTMLLETCSDFEFNICSFEQQSSPADELFANGMILPVRLQERQRVQICELPPPVSLPPRPKPSTAGDSKKDSMRQIRPASSESEEKPQSKSFWGFKRSSSLNRDIKKSLVCSLPLLSRSNSTGSAPNPKRSSIKDINKHTSQKLSMTKSSSSSSSSPSSCCSSCNAYQFPQKPPLKKNPANSYGSGVRISPVLNVPPPYISKGTANLFGLGSFLRNGKDKKSRK